jgi:hypothetical protein
MGLFGIAIELAGLGILGQANGSRPTLLTGWAFITIGIVLVLVAWVVREQR